jgi:hypothetical protein
MDSEAGHGRAAEVAVVCESPHFASDWAIRKTLLGLGPLARSPLECRINSGPDTSAVEERLAKNEVLFRTVNEAIEQQALRFGGIEDEYEFICECSSTECVEFVTLTLRQYEQIRAEGNRFVLVPGHANPEVELVVERAPHHHVVEKDGPAGIIAEQADPRSADTPSDFEPKPE